MRRRGAVVAARRLAMVLPALLGACASVAAPPPPPAGPPLAALPHCDDDAEQSARDANGKYDSVRGLAANTAACEQGCADACANAGELLQRGPRKLRDQDAGFRYFQRACAGHSAKGFAGMAFAHRMGWGTPPDYAQAKAFYRTACDMGYARGCTGLGDMFEHQVQGTPDSAEAARHYTRACALDQGPGCAGIAELYEKGRGVPRDDARAGELYVRGCQLGSGLACAGAGRVLERLAAAAAPGASPALRQRADWAYAQAFTLNRRGCNAGDPYYCGLLGDAFRQGKGVAQDLDRARRLYQYACDGEMTVGCDGLRALDASR